MKLPIYDKKVNEQAFNEFEIRQLMVTASNLRKQGYAYSHIASTLSCSDAYARNLVKVALREISAESVAELIAQETERLNAVFLPAFAEATKLDAKGEVIFNAEATSTVLKIMERRAKLFGLDRPTKTELSGDLTLGVVKPIQIYLPDNGRGLPAGLTIENGVIVDEKDSVQFSESDDLIFVEEVENDLSELYFDLAVETPHPEVLSKVAPL